MTVTRYGVSGEIPNVISYRERLMQPPSSSPSTNATPPSSTSSFQPILARRGGSCFGDSGGPILYDSTDVILGVNSFVVNGQCAGVGFAYRTDQPDVLADSRKRRRQRHRRRVPYAQRRAAHPSPAVSSTPASCRTPDEYSASTPGISCRRLPDHVHAGSLDCQSETGPLHRRSRHPHDADELNGPSVDDAARRSAAPGRDPWELTPPRASMFAASGDASIGRHGWPTDPEPAQRRSVAMLPG